MTIERDSGDSFIYPSSRRTAIGKQLPVPCSRRPGRNGNRRRHAPDARAHLLDLHGTDHDCEGCAGLIQGDLTLTLEHYIKSVPASARAAVASLDHLLKKTPVSNELTH